MKSIATITLLVSLFIAAIIAMPYVSCNKDKCKGVSCQNGGVCKSGSCSCPTGYGGANCNSAWRNKFLGNWTQAAASGSATSATQFSVSVTGAAGIDSVAILNFCNTFTSPVMAYLTSADTLNIPPQTVDSTLVEGYAVYLNTGKITVYYETLGISSNVLDTVYAQW